MIYVQFGCGFSAPEGWLNFDASPTLRFERLPLVGRLYTKNRQRFPAGTRYGDVVKGLPVGEGVCAGVYASHVLEHLALEDFDTALRNVMRYLAPGGRFRLVVPDLEVLARAYLQDSRPLAASHFMEAAHLGSRCRARGLVGIIKSALGNSEHLWMWDQRSMQTKLAEHGYTQIRRAAFNDSPDEMFRRVEDRDRFYDALAMECIRP